MDISTSLAYTVYIIIPTTATFPTRLLSVYDTTRLVILLPTPYVNSDDSVLMR